MLPRNLRIALGDLRHDTIGRHSSLMPLGIGLIASYALKCYPEQIEIRLYNDPDELLGDLEKWQPNVLGLSNYMWNAAVNVFVLRRAKAILPSVLTILGGPDFPLDFEECRTYLHERVKFLDFYAYLEGELVFAELIGRVLEGIDLETLHQNPPPGIMSLNPIDNGLAFAGPADRIADLNTIPSPYLTGLMDQWFNCNHSPSVQFARGCPYRCAYCRSGDPIYSKVSLFDLDRIKDELEYIAQQMSSSNNIALYVLDSNFGSHSRCEHIADHFQQLRKQYGWPTSFVIDNNTADFDRVFEMSRKLGFRIPICCDVQSLNPDTLEIIQRKNIPFNKYREHIQKLNNSGVYTKGALILPLPLETKDSFIKGIQRIMQAGVKSITAFTYMFLKGTLLNSPEMRQKFSIESRFRVIPHQFGCYAGERVFETEEVGIATSTMPFVDYLDCRGFYLVLLMLSDLQFDIIRKHIADLKIDIFHFSNTLWDSIRKGDSLATNIYNDYITETRSELFESEAAIAQRYEKDEYYQRLLDGAEGENLVRKYKMLFMQEGFEPLLRASYEILLRNEDAASPWSTAFKDALTWQLATRDLRGIHLEPSPDEHAILELVFDIPQWHSSTDGSSLLEYKQGVKYLITPNMKGYELIRQYLPVFGGSPEYTFAKIVLEYFSVDHFYKEFTVVKNQQGAASDPNS